MFPNLVAHTPPPATPNVMLPTDRKAKRKEKKRKKKEKTTPFGVNLMRSQALTWAAQFPQIHNHSSPTHYTICDASKVAAWGLSPASA